METIDTTINLNSPMFPHFWKAALLIAAFQEAVLLGGCAFDGIAYNGSAFGRLCFQEAVLSIAAFWEAGLLEAGL